MNRSLSASDEAPATSKTDSSAFVREVMAECAVIGERVISQIQPPAPIARIAFVRDALHAMTPERPHRALARVAHRYA